MPPILSDTTRVLITEALTTVGEAGVREIIRLCAARAARLAAAPGTDDGRRCSTLARRLLRCAARGAPPAEGPIVE